MGRGGGVEEEGERTGRKEEANMTSLWTPAQRR